MFLAKVQKNLSAARKKDIDEDLTDYKSKRKEQPVSKPKPSPTLESSNCFMYKYYKQFKLDFYLKFCVKYTCNFIGSLVNIQWLAIKISLLLFLKGGIPL